MSTENLVPELAKLVESNDITTDQAVKVQMALNLHPVVSGKPSNRSLWSEAFTYIGGAIVFISAGLMLGQTWDQLGTWGRPIVVAVAALILALVGIFLSKSRTDDAMRRLCSTLVVGTAILTAFAVGLVLDELWVPHGFDANGYLLTAPMWVAPTTVIVCAISAGLVAIYGYIRSHSSVGLLAIAASLAAAVGGSGVLFWIQVQGQRGDGPFAAGLALVITGGVWLYFAQRHVWVEQNTADIVGLGMLYVGGQLMRQQTFLSLPAIVAVALGVGLFYVYMRNREWPFLAAGLIFMLTGGIELVVRYVQGLLGAFVSMLLGIAVLVVGIRLFQDKSRTPQVQDESIPAE